MPKKPKEFPEKEMLKTFEASGLVDYMEYLQSNKRIMFTNFRAGIAKGLGLTLGMSVVLGLAAWILTAMVNLPVIGEWAAEAEQFMVEFQESTNYSDDFEKMNALLEQINENLQQDASSAPAQAELAVQAEAAAQAEVAARTESAATAVTSESTEATSE
jgi:hypothetical protein